LHLDALADIAASDSVLRSEATELLMRIALGRAAQNATSGELTRLLPGGLHADWLTRDVVRACAIERLAKIGTADAVTFLDTLRIEDVAPDPSHEVWSAVRIGRQAVILNRLSNPQERNAHLERILKSPPKGIGGSEVVSWAIDNLCESASFASLDLLTRTIRKRDSSERGDQEAQFCVARMELISQHPDRLSAFRAVLSLKYLPPDDRLVTWAITLLRRTRTPEADQELKRAVENIESLRRTIKSPEEHSRLNRMRWAIEPEWQPRLR
jgi:hypothetical protein